jgi:hypothetical protein
VRILYGAFGSSNRKVVTQFPRVLEQDSVVHRKEIFTSSSYCHIMEK